MPRELTVYATFSNGAWLRSTDAGQATHAYIARGPLPEGRMVLGKPRPADEYRLHGWARSAAEAQRTLREETGWYLERYGTLAISEVVEVTMQPMSAHEYRTVIARLGFAESDHPDDLGVSAAGRFFGAAPATGRNWARQGPPAAVTVCLRLMLAAKINAQKARKLLEG